MSPDVFGESCFGLAAVGYDQINGWILPEDLGNIIEFSTIDIGVQTAFPNGRGEHIPKGDVVVCQQLLLALIAVWNASLEDSAITVQNRFLGFA